MGVYDQGARYLCKRNPPGFFRWAVPRYAARFAFQGWQDTSQVAFPGEPDRICDTVADFAAAEASEARRLLDVEFQSEPEVDALDRFGEYGFRLRRELRDGRGQEGKYRVACLVVNMTGAPQPEELDTTEDELDGAGLHVRLKTATLRDEDAAATLARIARGELDPCVLPWVVLMRGGDEPANVDEWKRLATLVPDERLRADYAGIAVVFAELPGRGTIWRQALKGWNVKQSQQVLEWQQEARVDNTRDLLMRILRGRLHTEVPEDVARTIAQTDDYTILLRWFDAAQTAGSWEIFRSTIQNGGAGGSPPEEPSGQ